MIASLPPSLRRAVSPYTGIVRTVEECLPSTAEPALFQAVCEIADGTATVSSSLAHLNGVGGVGRSRAIAASAAVGEAIERYSASFVPREQLVVTTQSDLGSTAVDPSRFGLFSERQYRSAGFPHKPFGPDTTVPWVEGRDLRSGSAMYLPAELVFLGDTTVEGASSIGYSTSSGLACAGEWEDAVLGAFMEVLERDAFMITWGARLQLPLLEPDPGSLAAEIEGSVFRPVGLPYAAVDLSCFHRVPTVLAIVRAPASIPGAFGCGAACSVTVESAWEKALTEAFSARSAGAKLLLRDGELDRPICSFEDHIRYHADRSNLRATSFLDASAERAPLASVAPLEGGSTHAQIMSLCARAEVAGSSAYVVDVTSPDVADLGVRVARVVCPELCSLDVLQDARFLGGSRRYEAPRSLGLCPVDITEDDLNPDPHPFP